MKDRSSGKTGEKKERSRMSLRLQKWEGGRKALSVITMSQLREKAGWCGR